MAKKTQSEINWYFQENTIRTALDLSLIEKLLKIKSLKLPNNIIIHQNGKTYENFACWYCDENENVVYPKTYRECCEVLFGDESYSEFTLIPAKICTSYQRGDFITELPFEITPYETGVRTFYMLLICRDAYWKIAGEEMGLGKPWKPNWSDFQDKYGISYYKCALTLNVYVSSNKILVFPTEEMRDAFYENFKDLIEDCKELL